MRRMHGGVAVMLGSILMIWRRASARGTPSRKALAGERRRTIPYIRRRVMQEAAVTSCR